MYVHNYKARQEMDETEVLDVARKSAQEEGWVWRGKVRARKTRQYFFFGPFRWNILTNAGCRGSNIRMVIDDDTGEILMKAYALR
jgi:hypothetical protein